MSTSALHEVVVELFRSCPTLATTLLGDLLCASDFNHDDVVLGPDTRATLDVSALHVDLVLYLRRNGRVVAVVLIEVQRGRDPRKRYDWPAYVAIAQRAHRCPAYLLVVTLDAGVAAWARQMVSADSLGYVRHAHVIEPGSIERITDPEQARRAPEFALLSALEHAGEPDDADLAPAFVAATRALDPALSSAYLDCIGALASAALRASLETLMLNFRKYEFQSDLMKKFYAEAKERFGDEVRAKVAAEVRAEVTADVRAEVTAAVRAEARAEARATEKAADVLAVFEARGLAVSDELRARVLACTDLDQLGLWLRRAVTVAAPGDIFVAG